MNASWFLTTADRLLWAVVATAGIYVCIVVYTRVVGLRSFSKMSSFDFAITIAIGTVIGSTVMSTDPPLLQAAFTLACLYGVQLGVASLRARYRVFSQAVDNDALLIMDGPTMLKDNMRKAQITEQDVYAKLREANVLDLGQVQAVVLETTGDISVLHGGDGSPALDPVVLTGVRGRQRLED